MKIGFFPGCSQEGTALEYGQSVEWVAEKLGIDLVELEDWSCCGASSGHSTDGTLSLALPARNIAIAEKMGLPITVCCAACYGRFRFAEHELGQNAEKRAEIAEIVGMPLEIKTRRSIFWNCFFMNMGWKKFNRNSQSL